MAKPAQRSRQDYQLELARLKEMYRRLPPDKQQANREHFQRKVDRLTDAINGKVPAARKKSSGAVGVMQLVVIILLVSVVALAAGFFGVTYFTKS